MYSVPPGVGLSDVFEDLDDVSPSSLNEEYGNLLDEGDSFENWAKLGSDVVFQKLVDKQASSVVVEEILNVLFGGTPEMAKLIQAYSRTMQTSR
jgi:hypothetical protein